MISSAVSAYVKPNLPPNYSNRKNPQCSHRENRHLVINSLSIFKEISELPKEYIDLAKENLDR